MVHRSVDIEQLCEDEGREGNSHDVCKRFVEEHDGAKHYYNSLFTDKKCAMNESMNGLNI